jgi:hypothetical protein
MGLTRVDETVAVPYRSGLPEVTPESRQIVARAEARRLALMGDMQQLRARYEAAMRWLNPPWDAQSEQIDPRVDQTTPERLGLNKIHVDLVNQVVDRWAVLQAGTPPIFRCKPPYVPAPIEDPDDPTKTINQRKVYNIDRAIAQDVSSRMENQTQEWIEANSLHRSCSGRRGPRRPSARPMIRTGWDVDERLPTAELVENPSQVYYGWSKRYGRPQARVGVVAEEMDPTRPTGASTSAAHRRQRRVRSGHWTGVLDHGDMDQRPEQQGEVDRARDREEYHELVTRAGSVQAMYA